MPKKKDDTTALKKQLSSTDWLEITALYLKGKTPAEICKKYEKYDITPYKLKSRMKRDGIDWRKENIATTVKDRICEEIIDDKVKTVERIVKIYQNTLDVAEDILAAYKNEAMLNPTKPRATAYNLDQLSGAINKCHNGLKIALNIPDDPKEQVDYTPKINTIKGIDMEDI